MVTKALNAPYPFNDDEVAANLPGYQSFLAHSFIGKAQRDSERAKRRQAAARKKSRRKA